MKAQNVYVGQLYNPNHSAVYADVREAVKEVMRPMQAGFSVIFIHLPEPGPEGKYWVAGTAGENADPRKTFIFMESSKAEQHVDGLLLRGWPKSQVVCKQLTINTKGPQNIDIKTDEHYKCEQEVALLNRLLDKGLVASNSQTMVPLSLGPDSLLIDRDRFAILDMKVAGFSEMDATTLWDNVSRAATLLKEIAQVDPDEQPRKWARLQQQAADFANQHIEPDVPPGENL